MMDCLLETTKLSELICALKLANRRKWEDNIKMGLQEVGLGAWAGLSWLRIGTGGRLL
jgi:hypothetical protein